MLVEMVAVVVPTGVDVGDSLVAVTEQQHDGRHEHPGGQEVRRRQWLSEPFQNVVRLGLIPAMRAVRLLSNAQQTHAPATNSEATAPGQPLSQASTLPATTTPAASPAECSRKSAAPRSAVAA